MKDSVARACSLKSAQCSLSFVPSTLDFCQPADRCVGAAASVAVTTPALCRQWLIQKSVHLLVRFTWPLLLFLFPEPDRTQSIKLSCDARRQRACRRVGPCRCPGRAHRSGGVATFSHPHGSSRCLCGRRKSRVHAPKRRRLGLVRRASNLFHITCFLCVHAPRRRAPRT